MCQIQLWYFGCCFRLLYPPSIPKTCNLVVCFINSASFWEYSFKPWMNYLYWIYCEIVHWFVNICGLCVPMCHQAAYNSFIPLILLWNRIYLEGHFTSSQCLQLLLKYFLINQNIKELKKIKDFRKVVHEKKLVVMLLL